MSHPAWNLETRLRHVARALRAALQPNPAPFPTDAPLEKVFTFRNHQIRLEVPRSVFGPDTWRSLNDGTYEEGEMEMLGRLVRPNDTVLELGAALGLVSARVATTPGVHRVVAVEANPQLIPVAQRTYALNGVQVELINAVVSHEDGEIDFYIHPEFWASSTEPREGAERVRLPARSLSGLLKEVQPDVLIVDIEGGEVALLEGMRLPGVRQVVLEVHRWATGLRGIARVFVSMAEAGFAYEPEFSSGQIVTFGRQEH